MSGWVGLMDAQGRPLGVLANPLVSGASVTIASQTLNAANSRMVVPVKGLASAMIHVQGSAVATLKFTGTADQDGIGPAGRRLWKAGVGSLGVSNLDLSGAIDSEYRIVLGGQYIAIEFSAYTSGSVDVLVAADDRSPVTFVHGPVHTALEEAIRAGRAFTAGTSIQSVAAGNFLNTKLANPAGSGRNIFLFSRRFENNVVGGQTPLEFYGVANPVTALANALTPANLKTGGGASVMTPSWAMTNSRLDSSPSTTSPIGGVLATNGMPTVVDVPRLIGPGQSFGHYIAGTGGGLAAAARLGMTWLWYEEDAF